MALTYQIAQTVVQKAVEIATTQYQRPVCVSVCDSTGLLMAFWRVEGGNIRSVEISQAKAYTAVRMGVDTEAFLERLQRENLNIAYFCDPKMTALPGGVVLRNASGEMVGGIGLAGMKADEDATVARAMAELVKSLLN